MLTMEPRILTYPWGGLPRLWIHLPDAPSGHICLEFLTQNKSMRAHCTSHELITNSPAARNVVKAI